MNFMKNQGYLLIDAELGGSEFRSGKDAILELALLTIPEPVVVTKEDAEDFIRERIVEGNVVHFVIKPYAEVSPKILETILKKPIQYYVETGAAIDDVAAALSAYLKGAKAEYPRLMPVSDWHGDIEVIEFLLARRGESLTNVIGTYDMFHLNSFLEGLLKPRGAEIETKLPHTHDPRDDVRELGEQFIKARLYADRLIRSGRRQDPAQSVRASKV